MLAALAAGLVLVLGYCAVFQKQFGLFSMTVAGARQDMVVAIRYGYYPDFEDTEMAEAMCRTAETGDEDAVLLTAMDFGWARAQKAARTYFNKHPVQYLYDTAMQMGRDSVTNFHGYAWESKSKRPCRWLSCIPFGTTAYSVRCVSGIVWLPRWLPGS